MNRFYLLLLVLSVGCAELQKPPPGADFGTIPGDYESVIKSQMDRTLKDPESAKYRFGQTLHAWANRGSESGGTLMWTGQAVQMEINAKNSYGGYTGFSPWIAFFTEGRLVQVVKRGADKRSLLRDADGLYFVTIE